MYMYMYMYIYVYIYSRVVKYQSTQKSFTDVPVVVCSQTQEHQDFYESLFSLAPTPRSLQHLARCRIRVYLEGRLLRVVPKLPLPTFIQNYLLLQFTGYVH